MGEPVDERSEDGQPEAVDAATVVVVRDGEASIPDRLEVLLLERHLDSDFAGGALVFPGGKVDAADRGLTPDRWRGRDLAAWRHRLGTGSEADALGLLVAAVRETFEEAGVLLARREDGTVPTADDLAGPRMVEARRRLSSRSERWDWRSWLADERLVLDLDALAMWSWWVTPTGQHRRFDTRFLIARVPSDQIAAHDRVEMTSLRWIRPADALAAQQHDEVTIIFPTRCNLRDLARFGSADAAFEAASSGAVDQRRIQPKVVRVDGRPMVQHPFGGDPEPV